MLCITRLMSSFLLCRVSALALRDNILACAMEILQIYPLSHFSPAMSAALVITLLVSHQLY